jgi:urea transporter
MPKNNTISIFLQGLLRSYSQIFFSENYWFAVPLLIVSLLDLSAGFCGLLSVMTANLAASILKFDQYQLSKGLYGYNSLLVGLGLGYYYELTLVIIAIAVFSGFFTLFITIAFQGILGKYYLPNLSIPFVFSVWIVLSAGWMVTGVEDNSSGVYILNKLFRIGGYPFVQFHQWWVNNVTSSFLNSYLQSLGAIFFQFNVFAGMVVAVALLFYSRIAFVLSLLGYVVAYLAYTFLGMDMNQLGYTYIGFNFILGAIAIGGFFYIPSKASFLWAIGITPVIALVAAGVFGLLKPFYLPLLAIPFNIVLLTLMYALRFRTSSNLFREVVIQEGTPEKNLYSYQSFTRRFPNFGWFQVKLPFYGEWYVSQGHCGEHTHKGEWANAWDFVIVDNGLCQFRDDGNYVTDYYCYGQTVIAPADGSVVVVDDGIDDNRIGEVNTAKNWGNTVVIKHAEGLYSKLSHLQKGSIMVKVGDNVHYGQKIAKVGNSGRSPYPHLHFQLQATPHIGSKTLKYPLFAYLEDGKRVKTFTYPESGQMVKAVEDNPLLSKAFNLMPGRKMQWTITTTSGVKEITWEVFTTVYNKSYIYCHSTKSVAYFQNDGVYFSFTHFDGDRDSLLYAFYLAAFRVPLTYVEGVATEDWLPANRTFRGWRLFLHDFTAPFYIYLNTKFEVSMLLLGSEFDTRAIEYHSMLRGHSFNRLIWSRGFKLLVGKDGDIHFSDLTFEIEAKCEAR